MSGIAIFSGAYCGADEIAADLVAATGFCLLTDRQIIEQAANASGLPEKKLWRAFSAKTSVFNPFTHEKEFSIASLRLVLARKLRAEPLLVHGFCSLLIPRTIRDFYRVCITASTSYRLGHAQSDPSMDEQAALPRIQACDTDSTAWTEFLYKVPNPWDRCLYDIVFSMDETDRAKAVYLIGSSLGKGDATHSDAAIRALDDFGLSAMVETVLYRSGHDVFVSAKDGHVELTIGKQALTPAPLKKELCDLAGAVNGVQSVAVVEENEKQSPQIYHKCSRTHPSRVLLVDDEQEFVQTLSERLQLRGMGSAVTFDGETALDMVRHDPPEVMILDLKMPRLDGISVLASVKKMRPEIEVIVLTGHGNESDRKHCMDLGAFAYLQKPVGMEILSDTIKKAHEKIQTAST